MADARYVEFARELEALDARAAESLATLRALQAETEELRARAAADEAFRAEYPRERTRLVEAVAAAREELVTREAERAQAEEDLARAKEGEEELAARRLVVRAVDAESSARRKLARVEGELADLEREQARIDEEIPRLEHRAGELGTRLNAQPRTTAVDTRPGGLAGVLEWSSRARASLFVAAGGLETERDQIVREANELGAAALGEATLATSATLVRQRLERAANP